MTETKSPKIPARRHPGRIIPIRPSRHILAAIQMVRAVQKNAKTETIRPMMMLVMRPLGPPSFPAGQLISARVNRAIRPGRQRHAVEVLIDRGAISVHSRIMLPDPGRPQHSHAPGERDWDW